MADPTVDEIKAWLRAKGRTYEWFADAIGVARGTAAQWFRSTDPRPMTRLARRASGMLISNETARDSDLTYDELRHLELWSRREGIGVVELCVRIIRERLAAEL